MLKTDCSVAARIRIPFGFHDELKPLRYSPGLTIFLEQISR
jgi:hypothetical protein